ncbi:GNAT family N-acetyltransferase [Chitinophaga sp. S165]|uniref:GNAT family N-acetyltransferase n=1 Tax=Chitinophaga sp. S165 TaxID=2135462 RepID=UPI000D88D3B7|nr:GNAT family N-acetyltransferase [Chitinophaga sp. S165]PWV54191.1 ribosomal protein S18 acetylase RimI-like enzyme [Chitinophaga sp. S165]
MQPYHIAPITAGQLDILVQLEQQTFTETFDGIYTPEDLTTFLLDKKSKEALATEMNAPGALFFMVWHEQQPAGFLKLNLHKQPDNNGPLPTPVVEVEKIYVLQQFQGMRLGKLLIEHSFQVARDNKATTIWLGVWEHNHKAIRFYQQQGFEKFGEHIFQIGNQADTDWLMKKQLP